jgi:hypothetical protein
VSYHSALTKPLQIDRTLQRFESDGSIVFQHDLFNGLPPEYDHCDVLYLEPPWKDGYEEFNRRAGVVRLDYGAFIEAINVIIDAVSIPVIVVLGVRSGKYLRAADLKLPIKLNGAECVAYCFHITELPPCSTTVELLNELAQRYMRIGDPNCGYGIAGSVFATWRRSFVLSDYNGQCIAYCAKTLFGAE